MWVSEQLWIDPAYADALRAAGLASVTGVLDRTDGRVAAWSRTTDTIYLPSPTGGPGFYVKRYRYPSWRNRLRGAFRSTFFARHRGQAECRLLTTMRSLGIPAVRPVAYGSRRCARFVTGCFLITEEAPGARNLTAFAQDVVSGRVTLSREQKQRMITRLARQIADVHAAHFSHGQLFWRNMLVRIGVDDEPEFFFLDARPRKGRQRLPRTRAWWADELAHVLASAAPFTTRTERLQFLLRYFGEKKLTPLLKERVRAIEKLAIRWRNHEAQRIRMNRLFDEWNRLLEQEQPTATPRARVEG